MQAKDTQPKFDTLMFLSLHPIQIILLFQYRLSKSHLRNGFLPPCNLSAGRSGKTYCAIGRSFRMPAKKDAMAFLLPCRQDACGPGSGNHIKKGSYSLPSP
jgi:hypothetical protein